MSDEKNKIKKDIDSENQDDIPIIIDDDDDIDIVIEIDEEEEEVDVEEDTESEDIVLSKHKMEGRHALKHDSIFKGKKEEPLDENSAFESNSTYNKETIEIDGSSLYYHESINNEEYIREKEVREKVYNVLKIHTNINFNNNRRKPSRVDFNNYYALLKKHLREENFTNIELFNELAVYFSDNLFNMFKLLDNKWRNEVLKELEDHVGKIENSKKIINKNIIEGAEIEFRHIDMWDEVKIITGIVLETNYEKSTFKVDSYENIYYVEICDITKIINNSRFKYNLNKLKYIDFL